MPCSRQQTNNHQRSTMTLNQLAEPYRRSWRGEEWLVVPVVMAKLGVTMNGAQIPAEEFHPQSWNGSPVTFGHPEDEAGNELSANTPDVLDQWAVGTIFNSGYTGGKLKAEAWINVQQAEANRPGSVEALEAGELQVDVSTGYFAAHEQGDGVIIHRDIKPDHLAILFDVPGACSFADGCGVRANQSKGATMPQAETKQTALARAVATINKAFGTGEGLDTNGQDDTLQAITLEANRRGASDDFRQMVADLVSLEASPFVPDDMFALFEMSYDTLKAIHSQYGTEGNMDNNRQEDNPTAPEPGATNEQEGAMPEENTPAQEPETNKDAALSDEDRQALQFARNQYAEHRKGLVDQITANSNMTAEQLEGMDVPTLETVANGLRPVANYSVRGGAGSEPLQVNGAESEAEAEAAAAMTPPSLFDNTNKGEGK